MTHSRRISVCPAAVLVCLVGASLCWAVPAERSASSAASNAPLLTAIEDGAGAVRGTVSPREQGTVRREGREGAAQEAAIGESQPWYRQMLPALAIVLAVIAGAALLLKRIVPGARMAGRDGPIEVLTSTSLSPKQSLSLVRCGQRVVLIGVTPEHISALTEVTDPTEVGLLLSKTRAGAAEMRSGQFLDTLDDAAQDYVEDDAAWDEPLGPDADGRAAASAGREVQGLLARLRQYRSQYMSG